MIGSFNHAFHSGTLSISQRRGTISLIAKKAKDTSLLENLRPISLLNIDYKILTNVIAKRLDTLLPKVINPDHTGYLKGRYIYENVRLIQDVLFNTKHTNIPGNAIFLDFWKAFDSIEWEYLKAALKAFNFGPNLLKWNDVLHNEASSCVINNGHTSFLQELSKKVTQLKELMLKQKNQNYAICRRHHGLPKGRRVSGATMKTTRQVQVNVWARNQQF